MPIPSKTLLAHLAAPVATPGSEILCQETGLDTEIDSFLKLASDYLCLSA